MSGRAYLVWSLLVLLASYLVPYLLLRECTSLLLYSYWLLLTLIHFGVTVHYMRGAEEWKG